MCVTNHDMTPAVKLALNTNAINQLKTAYKIYKKAIGPEVFTNVKSSGIDKY